MRKWMLVVLALVAIGSQAQTVYRYDGSGAIVLNKDGRPIQNAKYYVCNQPASGQPCTNQVTLSTSSAGLGDLSQPAKADSYGNVQFYAAQGTYTLQIQVGPTWKVMTDIAIGPLPGTGGDMPTFINVARSGVNGDGGVYTNIGCTSGSGTLTSVASTRGRLPKVGDTIIAVGCGVAGANFSCTVAGGTATTGSQYGTVICASGSPSTSNAGATAGVWGASPDSSAALQTLINSCTTGQGTQNGCVLNFPAGVYGLCNVQIPAIGSGSASRITLSGLGGNWGSNIVNICSTAQAAISGAPSGTTRPFTVQGFGFVGGTPNVNQLGILVQSGSYIYIKENSFENTFYDSIQMYNTWLNVVERNRFYAGRHAALHFGPPGLGGVNATNVTNNWFDAYGNYGFLNDSSGGGGAWHNMLYGNDFEGTSATTIADVAFLNSNNNYLIGGYWENAGSQEISYHTLTAGGSLHAIIDNSPCVEVVGPVNMLDIQQAPNYSCWEPDGVLATYKPTLARVAASGTFPAGRDVYIRITAYNTVTTMESNPTGYVTAVPVIVNTALNDAVQVSVPAWQDSTGNWGQYCVYEADVATGAGAPAPETYKKWSNTCTNAGSTTLVTTAAALGSANGTIRPAGSTFQVLREGFGAATNYQQRGGLYQYADNSANWTPQTGWYYGPNTLSPSAVQIGATWLKPNIAGTSDDYQFGHLRIGGNGYPQYSWIVGTAFSGVANDTNYPTGFGANAIIPYGATFKNNYVTMPGSPAPTSALFMICNSSPCSTNTSGNAAQWSRMGEIYSKVHTEGASSPGASGYVWQVGDSVWNTNPQPCNPWAWFNVTNGSPGSWLAANLPCGGTTAFIGGSALTAGQCATQTVTITGAATTMNAIANPTTYPGDAYYWRASVTAANTVTVYVCAAVAGTPTSSVYNVKVIP